MCVVQFAFSSLLYSINYPFHSQAESDKENTTTMLAFHSTVTAGNLTSENPCVLNSFYI